MKRYIAEVGFFIVYAHCNHLVFKENYEEFAKLNDQCAKFPDLHNLHCALDHVLYNHHEHEGGLVH
jgi:hypothetical protein